MDDPFEVSDMNRPGQRFHHFNRLAGGLCLSVDLVAQTATVNEFHRKERQTIVFTDLVDVQDVRVM